MRRYFFDTDDGSKQTRDDTGMDLPDLEAVEREAREILFNIGHARLENGRPRIFIVKVRNRNGQIVCQGDMALRVERMG